jgi:hypothetical protein
MRTVTTRATSSAGGCPEATLSTCSPRKLRLSLDVDLADWLHEQSHRLHLSQCQIVITLLEWARSESVLDDLDLSVVAKSVPNGHCLRDSACMSHFLDHGQATVG